MVVLIRVIYIVLLVLLSSSCGFRAGRLPTPSVDLSRVSERSDYYLANMDRDSSGWILTDKCDSLVFSGILGAAVGGIDLTESESDTESGTWLRKPPRYGECSPDAGTSRSTISRDGILGVMWNTWRSGNPAPLERLLTSLRANNYQLVGEGTLGELLLTVNHINTIAEILEAMGSDMDTFRERSLSPALTYFAPGADGFRRHIMVWHILLRGEVLGYLSDNEKARLEEHSEARPSNPLYAAAVGRWIDSGYYQRAVELLELHYPSGRLPGSGDYCSEWPLEISKWESCEDGVERKYTGADLVSVYKLVLLDREI